MEQHIWDVVRVGQSLQSIELNTAERLSIPTKEFSAIWDRTNLVAAVSLEAQGWISQAIKSVFDDDCQKDRKNV